MTYEDLLTVPYKTNGRDENGLDCYGLVLICCQRTNQSLRDVVYETEHVSREKLEGYTAALNVYEIDRPARDCIVQCSYNGELHIGFMIDKKTVLHATYEGVRVTPVMALRNTRFFEVAQ